MIHFIINPAAGGGRALQLWQKMVPRLTAELGDQTIHLTKKAGDATQIAARLCTQAPDSSTEKLNIVAVGGDGTHHEVINGIYQALGPDQLSKIRYCLLPLGSGNDWIRTHRIPRKIDAWIDMYRVGHSRLHNLGLISYTNLQGQAVQTIFTNVAGMAYDAFVVQQSQNLRYKNRWLYPLLTLAYLQKFAPPHLQIDFDDRQIIQQFHTINVGISRYNGGGMRLVPQADPFGDQFALTYAPKLSIPTILANGWRFYTSTIGRVQGVVCTHATSIQISAPVRPEDLLLEADGELLGNGPVSFELIPRKLPVIVPRPKNENSRSGPPNL